MERGWVEEDESSEGVEEKKEKKSLRLFFFERGRRRRGRRTQESFYPLFQLMVKAKNKLISLGFFIVFLSHITQPEEAKKLLSQNNKGQTDR